MSDYYEATGAVPPAAPLVGSEVARLLAGTQPWVRWVAIWGFILVGFMALAGLFGGIAGAASGEPTMVILMIVYPLVALLYLFPALYLYRYANRIRDFLADRSEAKLELALEAQRAFWKFVGILLIVSLALMVIMFFFVIAAGAFIGGALGTT